jgi:gamma-glutamylcyclotransferase
MHAEDATSGRESAHFLYFAYGSNLHPVRLSRRTPSARVVGSAVLLGHALRFHKLGRDGSGKCDAHPTGNPSDRVHGAVYRIDERERGILDQAESLGIGYDACRVEVLTAHGGLEVWTYLARDELKVPDIRPFHWYLDFVIAGARFHALPEAYVSLIEATASIRDPEGERARSNRAILRIGGVEARPRLERC